MWRYLDKNNAVFFQKLALENQIKGTKHKQYESYCMIGFHFFIIIIVRSHRPATFFVFMISADQYYIILTYKVRGVVCHTPYA